MELLDLNTLKKQLILTTSFCLLGMVVLNCYNCHDEGNELLRHTRIVYYNAKDYCDVNATMRQMNALRQHNQFVMQSAACMLAHLKRLIVLCWQHCIAFFKLIERMLMHKCPFVRALIFGMLFLPVLNVFIGLACLLRLRQLQAQGTSMSITTVFIAPPTAPGQQQQFQMTELEAEAPLERALPPVTPPVSPPKPPPRRKSRTKLKSAEPSKRLILNSVDDYPTQRDPFTQCNFPPAFNNVDSYNEFRNRLNTVLCDLRKPLPEASSSSSFINAPAALSTSSGSTTSTSSTIPASNDKPLSNDIKRASFKPKTLQKKRRSPRMMRALFKQMRHPFATHARKVSQTSTFITYYDELAAGDAQMSGNFGRGQKQCKKRFGLIHALWRRLG